MTPFRPLASALCLLASVFLPMASASTVVIPTQQITGNANNRSIIITPAAGPRVIGTNLVAGGQLTLRPTNSIVTASLVAGNYTLSVEGLTGSLAFTVPDTNVVVDFWTLAPPTATSPIRYWTADESDTRYYSIAESNIFVGYLSGLADRSTTAGTATNAAPGFSGSTASFSGILSAGTLVGGGGEIMGIKPAALPSDISRFAFRTTEPYYATRFLTDWGVDTVAILTKSGSYWSAWYIQTNSGIPMFLGHSIGLPVMPNNYTNATTAGTGWGTAANANVWAGSYIRSSTSNDTISIALTGSAAFIRAARFSNCGYGFVAIDGDYTRANLLPKVTQLQVDDGTFPAAALGYAYADFYCGYGSTAVYDSWLPIADNLPDTAHTILVKVAGVKPTGASDNRVSLSGFASFTSTNTFGGGTVYAPLKTTVSGLQSAIIPVYSVFGGFVGEVHGGESLRSYALRLDGASLSLTNGEWRSGSAVDLVRTTTLTNALKTVRLSWVPGGVDCQTRFDWTTNAPVSAFYALMVQAYYPTGSIYTNDFELATVNGSTYNTAAYNAQNQHNTNGTSFLLWSSNHSYCIYADVNESSAGGRSNEFAFVVSRGDFWPKAYVQRPNLAPGAPITINNRYRLYRSDDMNRDAVIQQAALASAPTFDAVTASLISGSAAGVSNVPADKLSGTVPFASLPSGIVSNAQANVSLGGAFAGHVSGDGSAITNLSPWSLPSESSRFAFQISSPFFLTRFTTEWGVDTVAVLAQSGSFWSAWYIQTNVTVPTLSGYSVGLPAVVQNHTNATKTGAGWGTSQNTNVWGADYTRSGTSNDSISITVTGSVAWIRAPKFSNCGYGFVSIDGDFTRPNLLPKVTQAQIDAGTFGAGTLGYAYANFYCGDGVTSFYDAWIPVADNLTDAPHVIAAKVSGSKPSGASDIRVSISGFGSFTATNTFDGVTFYAPLITIASGGSSAVLPVYYCGGFVGESHGGETLQAYSLLVDGAPVTLSRGGWKSGASVELLRTSRLTNAVKTIRLSWAPSGVDCLTRFDWTTNNQVVSFYPLMVQAYHPIGLAYSNDFEQATIGNASYTTTAYNNANLHYTNGTSVSLWSTNHAYVVYADISELSAGGRSNEVAWVQSRADYWPKAYVRRPDIASPSVPVSILTRYRAYRSSDYNRDATFGRAAFPSSPTFTRTKSTSTNAFILPCPDGGSWIVRIGNDGTLTTATNSSNL